MTNRIPVTVLGATGVVGQRFVRRLRDHPWFELKHLAASERSEGVPYAQACEWRLAASVLAGPSHAGYGEHVLRRSHPDEVMAPIVFSALDAEPASTIEPLFAQRGAFVFSNASAFRLEPDVPLLVPEVNADHLELLAHQRERRGWSGAILTNPNCTTTVLVMALAPLHREFGVEALFVSSMQAVSGAGYPGVASLDILGNVVPHIAGEEQKVEVETRKLLGALVGSGVSPAPITISAACHRVPVVDGHSLAVSVRLAGSPSPDAVREVLARWRSVPQELALPSAPLAPLHVHSAPDRPQVRRDVEADGGMSVHVGRVRPCPLLGLKFSVLGHNTERGAAGGSILNAELALARGLIPGAREPRERTAS